MARKNISTSQFVYPVFLLILSCHILTFPRAAMDTISPGQYIRNPQIVISADQKFELGFFNLGNSSSYYLGIWYKEIREQTFVWVANRDYAVTASANLTINNDGNLVIRQGKVVYLVTDISSNGNVTATLLDSGNLVVRDENNNTLWQSFDFPTDTILPGMKLGYDKEAGKYWSYVSWKSADDPSFGNFVLDLDHGLLRRILITNGFRTYWTSDGIGDNNMYNFSCVSNGSMDYITYDVHDINVKSRFVMDISGQFKQFRWLERTKKWKRIWSQPRNQCDVYSYCGPFGSCNEKSAPVCSCLQGFEPDSIKNWNSLGFSGGCKRRNALQCVNNTTSKGAGDRFIPLSKVAPPSNPIALDVQSIDDCKSYCLNNCACSAYSYIQHGCSIWIGDLINLRVLSLDYISGKDIYLKLAAAEFSTGNKCRKKEDAENYFNSNHFSDITYCCPANLEVAEEKSQEKGYEFLIGKKWEDLLSFDFSICTSPTNYEQTEVKRLREDKNEVEIPLFSFSSVSAATNNFCAENKLGEGGFGPVYKGKLLKGHEVAVKRLSRRSGQGWNELKNEAMLIAKLQHKNLVKLLGCCIEGDEKILIYEYLPNKSLDFFLFDSTKRSVLDWRTRVSIIEGIAQGLLYLHQFSRLQIIHRDLKASNILLDEYMNPKISDFGMAKIFGGSEPRATNRIVGTYGYMAPEYALEGIFSVKSDVFSFGVLFLEILSGRKNTGFYQSNSLNLLGHVWDLWTNSRPLELMDPILQDSSSANSLIRYVNIALLCVQERAVDRPTMSDVVLMLSNELTFLSTPKQPAFSSVRSMVDNNSPITKPEICSVNEVTVSMMQAR
ncbi:S-locus lectin protein kinase family protein, putative [Theobroma cacao]|uniref:Receptor-like serine/threonine-protein kinase n=1 Tax=Theobroma cacao TaxID=3641 RepID=A0A061F798_THECC|nr:S-locus lectin protein kinase family protein, putative [Theobroma cacao]